MISDEIFFLIIYLCPRGNFAQFISFVPFDGILLNMQNTHQTKRFIRLLVFSWLSFYFAYGFIHLLS